MITVNVSGLKNNPSEALDMLDVRIAVATALFRDGDLSLARAASLAKMTLAGFIAHVSRLGIPVINQTDNEVEEDMDTLDEWLAS